MFKKIIATVVAASVVMGGTSVIAAPGKDLRILPIIVNGYKVPFPDTEPYIDTNGRTMVPVRFVSEKLGGKVSWDAKTETVGIEYNNKVISLPIGSRTVSISSTEIELDTAAELYEGRTMVPLRFVSEAMDSTVTFDEGGHAVSVNDDAYLAKVESGEVSLDPWGRERSKEVSSDWNKLSDLPESFYKTKTENGFTNKEYFDRTDRPSTEKEFIDLWSEHIRQYYAIQLNIDYRTIDSDKFAKGLLSHMPDRGTYFYAEAKRGIEDYVKRVKSNKVIARGYADPENSMTRFENSRVVVRVYFKFIIISATDSSQTFLDNYKPSYGSESIKLELGKWYGGYNDVRLGTNAATFQHKYYMVASGENMFRKERYSYSILSK